MYIIPKLQRRVNELAKRRVQNVRRLSDDDAVLVQDQRGCQFESARDAMVLVGEHMPPVVAPIAIDVLKP